MFDVPSLAAAARARMALAHRTAMTRQADVPRHYTRERVLRDIGLSRCDAIDSLSSPMGSRPRIRW
jgi:uncharacterized protein YjiS (DUF1127 family)